MAEAGEVPAAQLAETILEVAPPHFGKNIRVRACLPTEFGFMLCKSALDWPGCSCLDGSAPRQPCTAVRLILASRPPVPGLLIFLVALLTAGVHVWRQDLRRL